MMGLLSSFIFLTLAQVSTPKFALGEIPADILSWPGWGFPAVQMPEPSSKMDWPTIRGRVKVLVVEGTSKVVQKDSGLRVEYAKFFAPAKRDIARVLTEFQTRGKDQGALSIENLDQTFRLEKEDALMDLVKSRVSSGEYQADDKVFRGPYSQVWVIYPTFDGVPNPTFRKLGGTQVLGIPVLGGNPWDLSLTLSRLVSEGTSTYDALTSSNIDLKLNAEGLSYIEKGLGRGGRVTIGLNGNAKSLSFTASSTTSDPVELTVLSGNEESRVTLCGDPAYFDLPADTFFPCDGKMHMVTLKLPNQKVTGLRIGPPKSAIHAPKYTDAAVSWNFGPMVWDSAAPTETFSPTPDLPGEKLKLIANADAATLTMLADDNNARVSFGALNRISQNPKPEDEAVLTRHINSIEPWTSRIAIAGLAKLRTTTAVESLVKLLSAGFSHARAASLLALAGIEKDPRVNGGVAAMIATQSIEARADAATAASRLPGESGLVLQGIYMNDPEPLVRMRALATANASQSENCRKALWYQVNDPVDEIRALAALCLYRSSDEKFRKEAIKSIRDDSSWTRAAFLSGLVGDPIAEVPEELRDTLKIALVDTSESLQELGLVGLSKLKGAVTLEELRPLLATKSASVQAALKKLASIKGLVLPTKFDTIQR